MKVAALILGVIGGLAGVVGAVLAMTLGGLGAAFEATAAGDVVVLGFVGLGFSVLGLAGAAIAIAKPMWSGILMLISAVGGFIAIFLAYIVAAPLLLIAGVLALVAATQERRSHQISPGEPHRV